MKKISLVVALILAIIGSIFLLPQEVMAETKTWIGGEGLWNNPGNWSPVGLPAETDDIIVDGDNGINSIVHLDIDFNLEGSITIENGDVFVIDAGHVLHATGEILNGGIIDNEGTINNDSTIFNSRGTIYNNGAIYNRENSHIDNEESVIYNSGIISNNFSAIESFDSTIENSGTIDNNYTTIVNWGDIINYGTINNFGEGVFCINNMGVIDNYGTINNDGIIKNGGALYNNCGAIFIGNPVEFNPIIDNCNDPPIANDDSYSSMGDAPLNVPAPGVLENDTDPDSDSLIVIVESCTQPSNGTVSVNPDGSFSYTPFPGFRGEDSFSYKASDEEYESNTAIVTVTVNPTGLEQILSRLDNIEANVNKLDIEAFQMPSKTWCTYHIGASIGGLPVVVELEEAYAVRQVAQMQFENVFDYAITYSFGDGHIRVLMDMPDDFDVVLFQFVFVNPDTGLHGTIIVPHEYGKVWEKAQK